MNRNHDKKDEDKSKKAPRTRSWLQALLQELTELRRVLGVEVRVLRERPTAHAAWGTHVPDMAAAGVEMMAASPHFERLPFTSDELQEELQELKQLQSAKDQADALSQDLGAHIVERKNRLTDKVEVLRTTVRATVENPTTEPAVASAVHAASATFRAIYDARVQSMVSARNRTLEARAKDGQRVAEVAADRDRLAMEAEVLRGGKLTTSASPAGTAGKTARRGRKARR